MSDKREIEIDIPRPVTENQLKKVIEEKLKRILTDLHEPGDQMVVTLKVNKKSNSCS